MTPTPRGGGRRWPRTRPSTRLPASAVDLDDQRRAGVAGGAAGEQAAAAAALGQRVDQLDHPARPGRPLGVAVDQAATVWIDRVGVDSGLGGEPQVVNRERIVCLDDVELI